MTSLSAEVAEAVQLRDAATPGPWTTDVVVAATGLEHTSYAHQVKIGIHSYNVAFRNCQNWTSIIYGHESQRGEGKLEHDVSIHPDAALIAAAPSHVDLIQRLHARVRELEDEFEAFRINNELTADQMYYKGNSVSWWWSKATAYKAAIGKVCDVAIKHGLKFDGKTDVADLLDAHLTALKP